MLSNHAGLLHGHLLSNLITSTECNVFFQKDLRFCISKKVPVLLSQGRVKLIIIDSIAALFRCEFETHETIRRAKELSSFAAQLHYLSFKYSCPVVCVNQVSCYLCLFSWLCYFCDLLLLSLLLVVIYLWHCLIVGFWHGEQFSRNNIT